MVTGKEKAGAGTLTLLFKTLYLILESQTCKTFPKYWVLSLITGKIIACRYHYNSNNLSIIFKTWNIQYIIRLADCLWLFASCFPDLYLLSKISIVIKHDITWNKHRLKHGRSSLTILLHTFVASDALHTLCTMSVLDNKDYIL